MVKVFIMDQDIYSAEMLSNCLEKSNITSTISPADEESIDRIVSASPGLLIIGSTISTTLAKAICEKFRVVNSAPIIVTSRVPSDDDMLEFFNLGANDYLSIPLNEKDFIARVRSLLTLYNKVSIENREVHLEKKSLSIIYGSRMAQLSLSEYKILKHFFDNPGTIYNRDDIAIQVLGETSQKSNRSVDAHIKNIRKKFEKISLDKNYITTIRNVGYKIK